jgi:hypothetical protein
MKSVETLMRGAVDYAGLFPPAELDMPASVANYRSYRHGQYHWALGRFIVPVARLQEFEEAAEPLLEQELEPWVLSVLPGKNLEADITAILEFNKKHRNAVIDTIEIKTDPTVTAGVLRALPTTIEVFFELPWIENPEPALRTLAANGHKAKIRTGGVTADIIPGVSDVARFIDACRRHDIAFKATAGLHHPVRAEHALTYDIDSHRTTMHGFLNVFLAACLRHAGTTREEIEKVISEKDMSAFTFDDSGAAWRDLRMANDEIESARRRFAMAFGSCSFEEPIDDLKGLQLL